ncbi:MAG: Hsp20/alpha crystallin family protein [Candidatus Bathyarchaeota archaeon]|nr:MAG: Hsp20/alpha crystallin family protein [Candidatus Bathyarchaeota archaeon]
MRFDEIIREMEAFQKRMMDSMFQGFDLEDRFKMYEDLDNRFEALEKEFEAGTPREEWSIERIDKPGVKGFIAKGFFSSPGLLRRPTDILPPLRPQPKGPREPLHDITPEKDQIQIYLELPGVEEEDIKLDIESGRLSLEAGEFRAEIDLSRWVLDAEKMSTEYRNGVLKVTIPKEDVKEEMI